MPRNTSLPPMLLCFLSPIWWSAVPKTFSWKLKVHMTSPLSFCKVPLMHAKPSLPLVYPFTLSFNHPLGGGFHWGCQDLTDISKKSCQTIYLYSAPVLSPLYVWAMAIVTPETFARSQKLHPLGPWRLPAHVAYCECSSPYKPAPRVVLARHIHICWYLVH